MRTTLRLRIAGRVQGVGFRYSLQREAAARALTGWVRNRRDGSVEALLQGEGAAVQAVADWARRGPPGARVDRVEENSPVAELDQDCTGFETLPTA